MQRAGRRRWLAATVAGVAGLSARAAFGLRARAAVVREVRAVSGFDAVRWGGGGELILDQSGREHLSIEAEPAVLARVVTEVRERRLHIGFMPGRSVHSEQPIRWRLEIKTLSELDVGGAGNVRAGPLVVPALALTLGGSNELRLAALTARHLDARLDGAGLLQISGGQVEAQRVVIGGACDYDAPRLQSREAELVIDGSGQMLVAVAVRLVARIGGSGQVRYRGQPRVHSAVSGAGQVGRDDGG